MKVIILRLGHRRGRDARVTTHVGLTARALGAHGMILSGERDEGVHSSLDSVVENWGGTFEVSYQKDWEKALKDFDGLKVHLTMYGLPITEIMEKIRKRADAEDVIVVVGSEKVPGKVYELVDYNLAVTSQPHSEVSALAIFLDRLHQGHELDLDFPGGKRRINPCRRGKRVLRQDRDKATS